ncbi:MAG: HAD family hydrolase [Candidatus Hodarchaeota archaeon]
MRKYNFSPTLKASQNPTSILGIVFDIDGTLLNHQLAQEIAIEDLYSKNRRKIPNSSLEEFKAMWKNKSEQYMSEYLKGRISFKLQRILRVQAVFSTWECQLSSKAAWSIFNQYLRKYEQNWTLYEDVLPCLNTLKHYQLGIISNGDSIQQRKKLAITGIDFFFKSIIISNDIKISKPSSKIFKRSAEELKLSLCNIIYVGDNLETDVRGALNAGIYGVWINRTNQNYCDSEISMISTLKMLPEIINKIEKV